MEKKLYLKHILVLIMLLAFGPTFGQSLSGIPGIALWLRADTGVTFIGTGDSVTIWKDISGNGNDASSTPGARPRLITASTLNNKPSVSFDGVSSFLTGPQMTAFANNASSCGTYIFMVCKGNTPQTSGNTGLFTIGSQLYGLLWERSSGLGDLFVSYQFGDPPNDYVYSTSNIPSGGAAFPYKILEVRKTEGASVGLYANCVQNQTGNPSNASLIGSFTNATYNIGNAAGTTSFLNAEIAELIVVTGACLTGVQIGQIESYLGTRYTAQVRIGPRDTVITNSFCGLQLTVPTGYTSYLWSTGATTNSITATTAGTYTVSFKDGFGATQYDTTTIHYPTVTINSFDTVCQGSSKTIVTHVSTGSGYTYHWSSGQTTSSINATTAGNYVVTVTDANSCTAKSNTDVVTVDAFPTLVSLGPAITRCANNRIGLTSPTIGWNKLQFSWSNGSTDSVVMVVPPSSTYSLTVTDTNGCSATASVSVTVSGSTAPHVMFTGDTLCFGQNFSPNDLSDSAHGSYVWNFGDGTATSTLFTPTHSFSAPGTYLVHLTVSNTITSCTNDTVLPVLVNALPGASFQSGIVCTNNPSFTFADLSIPATGQTITSWSWIFGDGGNSILQNPSHNYTAVADTYNVSLTVTQANGCLNTITNPFIVEVPGAAPSPATLQFPPNGAVLTGTNVTLGWQPGSNAEYFELVISTDPTFSSNVNYYYNIFTNQKTLQLQQGQIYYWNVVSFNPCGFVSYSQTDTFSLFNASNIAPGNLALWLKADSGITSSGGLISQWNDISSNHNNATATGASEPTLVNQVPLLNFKPSVKFSGSNVMSSIANSGLANSSLSIFMVMKSDGALANGEPAGIFTIRQLYNGFWIERAAGGGFSIINSYAGGNGNPILSDATLIPNAVCPYKLISVLKNFNTSIALDSNSVFDVSKANAQIGAAFQDSVYNLGHMAGTDPYGNNAPYGYMNGEIAEIIIYNRLLTNNEQSQVNSYIFNKYAPPVNLGPDVVQSYKLCPVTLKTGSRFVSYLWSTGATSDTLIVTKSGSYWVRTIDVFNRISSDTINVTLPYLGSNPDTLYVCHGDTSKIVQLINQPSLYTYIWYDSTSPSSVVNMNINANTIYPYSAGYYYTKITDSSHCSFITPKVPLIIDNFYSANLLPTYDTICRLGTLITNTVPYSIDSFLWQPTGDTVPNPIISGSGTYYLRTVDSHGCINTDSTNLTTRAQAPSANFIIPNYCLANTTYFVDSSFAAPGDSIVSYSWNFGGGIPSTDTNSNTQTSYRVHNGFGNYTVSLRVTTDSGCFAIATKHITILPSPIAGYTDSANNSLYPYILCAGSQSSLQLTDTSDAVGNSSIVQRYWKINGVTYGNTNANIQYTFLNQGTYDVQLEVINSLGCADSITQVISVYAPFEAEFSFSDHCLGDYTTFTDQTQSLSIVNRTWKFRENGDGPYAYTPTTQIQFQQPSTYDVELDVQNAIGCIAKVDHLVKIVQKPTANFGDTSGCQNHSYTPIDESLAYNDTINHWTWNIGGSVINQHYPSVLLADTGLMSVSLKISTQEGCADSITRVIEVGPVPDALFSFNPLYGTAPLPITFSNHSTGATIYTWDFGDGNTVTTAYPQISPAPHTYTQNGNYDVTLYAYNGYGCYDSLMRTINVIPTDLDLAVELVNTRQTTLSNGTSLVTVIAYISNLGTRVITSAQLYATLGNRQTLEQSWSGYLPSGQTMIDTFPAQFVVSEGYTNTFVCVNAENVNNGETETNYDNNQECASLTNTMQLSGPSPSPAINEAQLGIILPAAGTVYLSIMDLNGRVIIPEFSMNLPIGRTNYEIPVASMQGAEYFIRVRYLDDTQVRKFILK